MLENKVKQQTCDYADACDNAEMFHWFTAQTCYWANVK